MSWWKSSLPAIRMLGGVPVYLIFRLASRKPATLLEGKASHIRTYSIVRPALILKTCFLTRVTVTYLLIDGKAAFTQFCDEFGEHMAVNEGDRLCVAGYPQTNGLNNHLTQGAQSQDLFNPIRSIRR